MCRSMVDIQSATAEIRRGIKKEDRRKKPLGKNIMFASASQGGHNYSPLLARWRRWLRSAVNKQCVAHPGAKSAIGDWLVVVEDKYRKRTLQRCCWLFKTCCSWSCVPWRLLFRLCKCIAALCITPLALYSVVKYEPILERLRRRVLGTSYVRESKHDLSRRAVFTGSVLCTAREHG